MRSVKFDRGDVMRSRNGWPLKVTFQSSPPAVSRGITGCFAIQNIGEVSRSDGGVKEMEIDDKRYKYIYNPSDNGVEQLPVGIRFVVSSAPTSRARLTRSP